VNIRNLKKSYQLQTFECWCMYIFWQKIIVR